MMAGLMTFSACSNEDILIDENPNNNPEAKGVRIFKAFIESDVATRATIDGLDVKWDYDDAISIFDNSGSKKYMLKDGGGSTSGTFEAKGLGVNEESDFYSIYPCVDGTRGVSEEEAWNIASNYITKEIFDKVKGGGNPISILEPEEYTQWQKVTAKNFGWVNGFIHSTKTIPACTMEGNVVKNVFLPFVQTVDVEKGQVVDPKAVLMVAKADENHSLPFKNACAYIKVTTTTPCKKIVVEANHAFDAIAGIFDVAVSDNPTISPANRSDMDGPTVITFQAKEGDLAANTTYYIAVLPGTLQDGISVRFYTSDEYFTERTKTNSIALLRNKVYNGGMQPDDPELGTKGVAKAIIKGVECEMVWYQLWAGGPRFAIKNVYDNSSYNDAHYNIENAPFNLDHVSTYMSFYDAIKTGNEYAWGSNWYTADKEDMDELMKAAQGDTNAKVTCEYGSTAYGYGFTFTGKGDYSGNSVFFPAQDGHAYYWSSTANGSEGYRMELYDDGGVKKSDWDSFYKSSASSFVRPVLKR